MEFGYKIEDRDIAAFERDGVIVLRGIVGTTWREKLAAAVDREMADPAEFSQNFDKDGRFHQGNQRWRIDPDVRDYVFNSDLPFAAAQLLRSSKVNLVCDQLFLKEPGTADLPSPWHQDQVVFPTKGANTISFWTSLDPITLSTGAMEFIRGSHRWGRLFQPRRFSGEAIYPHVEGYEETPDFNAQRDMYDILTWDLDPGDALAFAFTTVHSARGNASNQRRRRAYTIRYAGDGVSYYPHAATMKMFAGANARPGGSLDSDLFPLVWPRPETAARRP